MRKNNNVLWVSILSLIVFFTISLTGCSKLQTRINLMGESENWSAELDTTVTNERAENGAYTVFYKKDNLEDIKGYKININEGSIIRQESDLTSKSISFPIMRTQGSSVSRNEDQAVVIEWTDINGNNFEEKLILREK
ncbi:hypothetical protein [Paenibacillus sp. UMB7766-LJ446]|uniref:hypothetical protein n=1 Tax=Paenibacillus sp. UMB7766-LJ446 TaxID=3046313 RepID=UPI00254EB10C|nr:hypothetical protein [Paenibacillus sp. UMB7766-LJ446]